jgi:hypothetical protein
MDQFYVLQTKTEMIIVKLNIYTKMHIISIVFKIIS